MQVFREFSSFLYINFKLTYITICYMIFTTISAFENEMRAALTLYIAISIEACLLTCLFSCKDSQIGLFNSFRSGLNVSISSFSRNMPSFIEKDLVETL